MHNGDRINSILNHDLFKLHVGKIEELERDRIFCRHDMGHFLDVARLSQILNLSENLNVQEEWIYAAALLHDIGRHEQYTLGTPHEKASVLFAPPILKDCGFEDSEADVILYAVSRHRTEAAVDENGLAGLLYRADKMSRCCYICKVSDQCSWKTGKKNRVLIW